MQATDSRNCPTSEPRHPRRGNALGRRAVRGGWRGGGASALAPAPGELGAKAGQLVKERGPRSESRGMIAGQERGRYAPRCSGHQAGPTRQAAQTPLLLGRERRGPRRGSGQRKEATKQL